MRILFLVPLLLMLNTGCSLLRKAIDPPQVEFKQVRVENVALSRATLIFDLEVFNPNSIDIQVDSIDYKLILNDQNVADGSITQRTSLPAKETTAVALPVEVEYGRFVSSLFNLLQKPEALYQLDGKAHVGPFSIPFGRKGKVALADQ